MLVARAYHRTAASAAGRGDHSRFGPRHESRRRCASPACKVVEDQVGRRRAGGPGGAAKALGPHTAAMMLTNPNTLGIFERQIEDDRAGRPRAGALLYLDGANMNALVGLVRPGEMGFDMMHLNLHKTFSHAARRRRSGGGAVAVRADLSPFLPAPVLEGRDGVTDVDYDRPRSIGGSMLVPRELRDAGARARLHLSLGGTGLTAMTRKAILNANYSRGAAEGATTVKYPGLVHARVRAVGGRAEDARRAGARRVEAASRFRDARADDVLPADRGRGVDDRADRDGDEGDARRVRRDDAPDRARGGRGSRAREGGAAHDAGPPAGRGARRAQAAFSRGRISRPDLEAPEAAPAAGLAWSAWPARERPFAAAVLVASAILSAFSWAWDGGLRSSAFAAPLFVLVSVSSWLLPTALPPDGGSARGAVARSDAAALERDASDDGGSKPASS